MFVSSLINCEFTPLPDGHRSQAILQDIEENWNWASYITETYT